MSLISSKLSFIPKKIGYIKKTTDKDGADAKKNIPNIKIKKDIF